MRIRDPGLVAVRAAARAAIVVPLVFAICDLALDSRQASITGSFGAIAFLVFAGFTGRPGPRLRANLGLAALGFLLIPWARSARGTSRAPPPRWPRWPS